MTRNKIMKKVIASVMIMIILFSTTGITNIVEAENYEMLKGTIIIGANYNQPLESFYQESVAIGTTKTTGIEQTWSVETGMHEFSYDRRALNPEIPISKWVAIQYENDNVSQGQCVHGWIKEWTVGNNYFKWGNTTCGRRTIPAWSAYCADCGQSILRDTYIYLNSDHVSKITHIDCSEDNVVVSGCIFCGSEEQASVIYNHTCKGASYNKYYVSYNGNGATGGATDTSTHMYENATTYDGVEIERRTDLSRNKFTREGYVSIGWNTKADGTGTMYKENQEVKNLTPVDGETITLYAQWVKDNMKLTVNPNSGTWNGSTQQQSFTITYEENKAIPIPTKTGYEFTGWTLTGKRSSMTSLTGNATFTMGIEDATLTANWKPIKYQVHYDGNGATSGYTDESTHIYDQEKELTTNGYQRNYQVTYDYNGNHQPNETVTATATFNGWATSNSAVVSFENNQIVKNLRTSSGTYNLYANWTLASVILPDSTRGGYNSLGWSTSKEATKPSYSIGETYTPVANTTLYMIWEPYSLKVNLQVQDEETKNKISREAKWDIYEWNRETEQYQKKTTLERQADGNYLTSEYLVYSEQNEGKYRLVEQEAPNGYYGDWTGEDHTTKKTYDFNLRTIIENQNYEGQEVQDKGTIYLTKENKRQKGAIEGNIIDEETQAGAQADGTLEGAVYGIYAKEDIIHADGVTGILYHAGEQVERKEIKNGKLVFENLELGNYEIKQISPSEGYQLSEETYPISISYEGEHIQLVEKTQTVAEKIKKQAFQLLKLGGLETDTEFKKLQNAGFKIYLISNLEGVKQGKILPDKNGNYQIEDFKNYDFSAEQTALDYTNNKSGEEIPEEFTDAEGRLISRELAYGKYIVIESTVPKNYLAITPFFVNVTEDSREPQELRTLLDKDFSAKLKIIKKDNTSKQIILKTNAKYRILDIDRNQYVEQEINGIKLGSIEHPYTTDETGTFITPVEIRFGNYELQEVAAPEGYVLTGKEGISEQGVYLPRPREHITFTISQETVQGTETQADDLILVVEQYNERQVGSLTIKVQGEYLTEIQTEEEGIQTTYEKKGMPKVTFAIYAKEDIYSPDGQGEILYHKDEKIKNITSNENGIGIIDSLPLGKYYVEQMEIQEKGFIPNAERKEVELSYVGDKEAVSYATVEYENERQKARITLENQDKETKEKITESTFALYTQEEIKYQNEEGNEKSIPANTKIDTQILETEKIVFGANLELPLGKYKIKQLEAPEGYASNKETVTIDVSASETPIEIIEKEALFENSKTKLRIKLQDRETKEGLANANLRLLDENGTEIKKWTTEETGEIVYRGLSYQKPYILEEQTARPKYEKELQKEEIEGEVETEKNREGNLKFTLKDTEEEQQLTVSNLAKVAGIKIEKQGDILVGTERDEQGNIKFQYKTENLSNANFEIYANEVIEHPDGHTGILFTEGMKIAEGITTEEGLQINKINEEYPREMPSILERGLALGNYRIIETKAPKGYHRNPEEATKEIELEENKEITQIIFNNTRQTVEAVVHKYDTETKETIKDVELGIYTAQDLIENGNTIIEKDTLVQRAVTDEKGQIQFQGNIPLGNYYVKEIQPAKGYIKTQEQIQIQAEELEENRETLTATLEFANQKTKINVIKITTEGQGIIGAQMQLQNEEKEIVESWTTDGYQHHMEGLEIQKNYKLQEIKPAKGFVTAKEISFQIDDEGKIITQEENLYTPNTIQMKDELTKVDIEVIDKETKEPIPGITIQIRDKETKEVVAEYVTTEEPQRIIGLPIGEYDIIQTKLPEGKGYVTTNAELTIIDTEEVQEKVIEQDYTKVKLEILEEGTEEKVDKIEIYLIDPKTKEMIASSEEIENKLKIKETEEGYIIEKLPQGEYQLVQKVPEGYVEIEDTRITIEDTKEEQTHTSYTRKLILDMKVEKQISSIYINGEKNEIQNPKEMQKVEVVASKLKTEKIELEYTIKISNTGEIAGSVGKIIEKIPQGFSYESNKNKVNWKLEGTNLVCDEVRQTEIEVGESIEVTIRLKWNNDENNFGEKTNTVKIEGVTNKLGYIDETSENDIARVTSIFSIKTGLEANTMFLLKISSITIITMAVLGIIILLEIKFLKK